MDYISKVNLEALQILVNSWKELANESQGKQKDGKAREPTPAEIKLLQTMVNKGVQ